VATAMQRLADLEHRARLDSDPRAERRRRTLALILTDGPAFRLARRLAAALGYGSDRLERPEDGTPADSPARLCRLLRERPDAEEAARRLHARVREVAAARGVDVV
jgi:hypothetical protein